jgi:hypothetical protein
MASSFNRAQLERQLREAQRQAEAQMRREFDRVNRENQRRIDQANREVQRRVDAHNREAQRHNQRVMTDVNRQIAQVNNHNRRADAHNRTVIADLNRQLRNGGTNEMRYTDDEQLLADRVAEAVALQDHRAWDVFLSYARIDGSDVGAALKDELEALGVTVWFDEVAIVAGQSQALQMDRGLRSARCGVALLTPAYLAGRFWTERELGALLHKQTLIPVLNNVTFAQVAEYSGILPDLAGFETRRDSVQTIAQKIAAAVLGKAA